MRKNLFGPFTLPVEGILPMFRTISGAATRGMPQTLPIRCNAQDSQPPAGRKPEICNISSIAAKRPVVVKASRATSIGSANRKLLATTS